ALASPAVHLFADRAAAVQPGFAVHDANVADVVQICRRLDGLPLAIELAAARLRTLPLHAIASRLDNRFRLLTGGSRTAMPRHQTLRAVVAWSWELLSGQERDLAERLSVYPGGITAESATAVHSAPSAEIDDLLAALVDKSLLQPVDPDPARAPHADPAPRYRMLETLREYGIERLTEAGTIADVRRAHARYFRDLAEQAEPHLRRREQLTWLARLDADHDNILAALRFAADSGEADTAIRLAAALAWYWSIIGQTAEGRVWLALALSVDGDSPAEAHAVVTILHALSGLFSAQDWTELSDITDALATVVDDPGLPYDNPLLAIAACTIPIITDDLPAVVAAVAVHENHPDPWVRGMLHLMRGMAAENSGDLATQRRDLEEARRRFAEIGERWGLSATLSVLAGMAMADGDTTHAMQLQDEALTLLHEINAADDAAQIQMMRATALARIGNQDEAKALVNSILESARQNRSHPAMLLAYIGLADIARYEGDTDTAWQNLRESYEITRGQWQGPPQLLALREVTKALLYLAGTSPDAGETDAADAADRTEDAGAADDERTKAKQALHEAYALGTAAHDMPVLSRIAIGIATYADATGDSHGAARFLGTADALRGGTDLGDPDRADVGQSVRAQLGNEEYDATFALGRAMARQEGLVAMADHLGIEPSAPRGFDEVSGG
uniref:ATP-binding protein n=1 Tax=Catenulispora pinisilvae TaxID=2705253 RepID=UPI003F69CF64